MKEKILIGLFVVFIATFIGLMFGGEFWLCVGFGVLGVILSEIFFPVKGEIDE